MAISLRCTYFFKLLCTSLLGVKLVSQLPCELWHIKHLMVTHGSLVISVIATLIILNETKLDISVALVVSQIKVCP